MPHLIISLVLYIATRISWLLASWWQFWGHLTIKVLAMSLEQEIGHICDESSHLEITIHYFTVHAHNQLPQCLKKHSFTLQELFLWPRQISTKRTKANFTFTFLRAVVHITSVVVQKQYWASLLIVLRLCALQTHIPLWHHRDPEHTCPDQHQQTSAAAFCM